MEEKKQTKKVREIKSALTDDELDQVIGGDAAGPTALSPIIHIKKGEATTKDVKGVAW